jgi:hypothetical protein
MFHVKDNLFVGREPRHYGDGRVKIVKFNKPPFRFPTYESLHDDPLNIPVVEITLSASEWASVVSSVSFLGETSEMFERALANHMERE